ncbi:MAG: AAA family ATPase [Vulcanimicrobiota bacterium]
MRPLHLTIEGLRSYRSRIEIDFTEVGLFAITGQTGAGKSSILEALVFALYHASTFDKTRVKALITDGLDDMTVSLLFRARGGEWRVTRSISNLASRPPVHELRTPDGELLEKKKEVDDTIASLLGLECDDFLKTVVLPQGKFQALLHSKPADRAPLLKSLLGLDELDRISEVVASQRERLSKALNTVRGLRSGLEVEPDQLAELQARFAELQVQENTLAAQLEVCEEIERKHAAEREQRAGLEREQETLDKVELPKNLATFQELEAGFTAEATRLEGAFEQLAKLKTELDQAQNQRRQAGLDRAGLEAAAEDLTRLETDGPRLAEIEQELAALLESIKSEQQQQAELDQSLGQGSEKLERVGNQGQTVRAELDRLKARQQEAQTCQNNLKTSQAALDKLAAQRSQLEQDLGRQAEQQSELACALDQARQAREQAEDELKQAERANLAAALCHDLDSDQPCPVCQQNFPEGWTAPEGGALEPLRKKLEKARKKEREAQRHLDQANAQHGADSRRVEQLTQEALALAEALTRLSTDWQQFEAENLEAEVQRLDEERNRLAGLYEGLRAEHKGLQQQLEQSQQRLSRHQNDRQQRQQRLDQLGQSLEQRRQRLHQLFGETDLRERLAQEREACTDLERQERELLTHQSQLHQDRDQLQKARRDELETPLRQLENCLRGLAARLDLPFEGDTVSQLQAALANLAEARKQRLQALQEQLSAGQAEQEAARQALSRALAELGADSLEQARGQRDQLRENRIRAGQSIELAEQQLERAAQLDQALLPGEQLERALDFLHGTLGNRRSKGSSSFSQWMLARRQRELLEIASRAFGEMTDQQYGFSPDFEVVDRGSGQARRPNTLSGGESFLASLALALALSELVGRRGGRLEAFFLDEGFGSLSPECLDRALDALESLAQSGRLIGLISHVAGVAERIETVWRVVKTPTGSRVEALEGPLRIEPAELLRELAPPPPPEPEPEEELGFDFDPERHPLFAG